MENNPHMLPIVLGYLIGFICYFGVFILIDEDITGFLFNHTLVEKFRIFNNASLFGKINIILGLVFWTLFMCLAAIIIIIGSISMIVLILTAIGALLARVRGD
jgi:hypothetical protein